MASMNHIAVVLVSPKEEGNVGAVARAMDALGAGRLVLVAPRCALGQKARARACDGEPLLDRAELLNTVEELTARFQTLAAFTARTGEGREPIISPRQLAATLFEDGPATNQTDAARGVALLFGPEESGLDNAVLQLCHHIVRIPARPGSSLNLSHAVALALYDLRCALMEDKTEGVGGRSQEGDGDGAPSDAMPPLSEQSQQSDTPAPNAAIEEFLADFHTAARLIDHVHPHNEAERMWRYRRLLHRARLTNADLWMLRGLVRQIRAAGKDQD